MRWTAKTFRAKRKVLKAGSSCSRSCTNTRTTIGHLQACKRFCMCLQKKPDSFIKRSTFFCLCERYMEIRDLHRCGLVGLIASHRFQQRGSFFSQAGKRFRSMCFHQFRPQCKEGAAYELVAFGIQGDTPGNGHILGQNLAHFGQIATLASRHNCQHVGTNLNVPSF